MSKQRIAIQHVDITQLKPAEYNPRVWSEQATADLKESVSRFGLVDPILVNNAPGRENVVLGGHFRLKVAEDLSITEVPVFTKRKTVLL